MPDELVETAGVVDVNQAVRSRASVGTAPVGGICTVLGDAQRIPGLGTGASTNMRTNPQWLSALGPGGRGPNAVTVPEAVIGSSSPMAHAVVILSRVVPVPVPSARARA